MMCFNIVKEASRVKRYRHAKVNSCPISGAFHVVKNLPSSNDNNVVLPC